MFFLKMVSIYESMYKVPLRKEEEVVPVSANMFR